MTTNIDIVAIVLRALVYVGTIASVGAFLFHFCFPRIARAIHKTLRTQMLAGVALVLLVEPVRYGLFLLAMSGGDPSLALSPDMARMGFEMPPGQASLVRVIGLVILGLFGLRYLPLGILGAIAVIGSYAFEGHSAAADNRIVMATLLLVHLVVVHWWIGALIPLVAATRHLQGDTLAQVVEQFGLFASWLVPALLVAGFVMLALIVDFAIDLANPYQQRFALKIIAVAGVLALAALNKFRITPLLRTDPSGGAKRLRKSIYFELSLAMAVLLITAIASTTSPDMSP